MVAAASQGLGFAIAKMLAAEGALVSIAARKQETICAAAARMQEQTGAQVIWSVADVGSAEAIDAWHRAVFRPVLPTREQLCAAADEAVRVHRVLSRHPWPGAHADT